VTRISVDCVEEATKQALEAGEDQGKIFVHALLARILKEPALTKEQIEKLPNEAWITLCQEVARLLGVDKRLTEIDETLPIADRVFLAYQTHWKEIMEGLVSTITRALAPLTRIPIPQIPLAPLHEAIAQAAATHMQQVLNKYAEQQAELLRSLTIEMSLQKLFEPIEQRGRQLTVLIMKAMSEPVRHMLQEAELVADEVGPVFRDAGFWLTPSMPMSILWETKRLKEQGELSADTLKQVILEYFREDNGAALEEMLDEWRDDPRFAPRMHIFEDALEAHLAGKYTLSVPTLLPHIEGIASCIVGIKPGSPSKIMDRVEEVIVEDSWILRRVAEDVLVKEIKKSYGYLDFDNFDEELKKEGRTEGQLLHRHAILHGVQVNYASEENSLRAFLLLDELHRLGTADERKETSKQRKKVR
jgi:AcrR family transcriptional regulator